MRAVVALISTAIFAFILAAIGLWLRPVSYITAYSYLRLYRDGGQSRDVTADGLRIHYDVAGPNNATPVVLVHGLGGRAENWENLLPYLTRAGYRVYMPDLPGFGRSEKPPNFSYSVKDQAATLTSFLNAVGLPKVDLGGWSMGGWIVQLVAGEHPERIQKLILFDSAGLNVPPSWNTHLFTPDNLQELHQFDALLTRDPVVIPRFVSRDLLRTSKQNAWVVQRSMQAMLTGANTTDDLLPHLQMPVLIVWGTEDRVVPLSQAETIHRLIPQSQLELASGCGHLAVIQCANQIGPGLVNFLQHP